MARVFTDISISLDGYVAGPSPSLEDPLGVGGMQVHEWMFRLAAWREAHGLEGGDVGPESEVIDRNRAATGAVVMGRRMFSGGDGPWADDPNANGWWGDEPPFHTPVFVVTHHPREPLELRGTTFAFVTDGVAAAIELARAAAGDRDVSVGGGASVVQQALALGLLDELQVHTAPVLLGSGTPLFDGAAPRRLEIVETVASTHATFVRYRVA
ncbi:MAG TPA: dihydrofolate reductase family protein [Gaiellaceae bacterium]|nr:dihydrofolate reductase family protein [Gaiellaceae bacterium]